MNSVDWLSKRESDLLNVSLGPYSDHSPPPRVVATGTDSLSFRKVIVTLWLGGPIGVLLNRIASDVTLGLYCLIIEGDGEITVTRDFSSVNLLVLSLFKSFS